MTALLTCVVVPGFLVDDLAVAEWAEVSEAAVSVVVDPLIPSEASEAMISSDFRAQNDATEHDGADYGLKTLRA